MKQTAADIASHLTESAREALKLTDAERIHRINGERWIGYARAKEIYSTLENLLTFPRVGRMPNLLILGPSNNGKTMIANRFVRKHPASDNTRGEGIVVPVLLVRVPVPDENRFYNKILDAVFAPYKPSDHVSKKEMQVINTLRRIGLRMLIIDDIHDMLAGHLEKQRRFLNVLRLLGNELKVSIVATGTKDAVRALQSDVQLANRFEPMPLPKWKDDDEYMKLLTSFEAMLPLKKPSHLADATLATKILSMGEGLIGEIATILRKAAIYAIEEGTERVDMKALEAIRWTGPSDRKRVAERLV